MQVCVRKSACLSGAYKISIMLSASRNGMPTHPLLAGDDPEPAFGSSSDSEIDFKAFFRAFENSR